MKTAELKFFLLLVSAAFVVLLAYAEDLLGSQHAMPEVNHGQEQNQKENYHHGQVGDSMESKRAGQILGNTVISKDGTKLGTLHDLVIFGKGFVHYGILELEDRAEEYIAIPFEALESQDEKDTLMLQMDSEKVKGAPTFSMDEITDWDNSEIGEKVHKYFGMDMLKGHPHGKKQVPSTGDVPESGMQDTQ
jgi:hypothetical protein